MLAYTFTCPGFTGSPPIVRFESVAVKEPKFEIDGVFLPQLGAQFTMFCWGREGRVQSYEKMGGIIIGFLRGQRFNVYAGLERIGQEP